jgi:hypothetical protein
MAVYNFKINGQTRQVNADCHDRTSACFWKKTEIV